MPFVSTGHIWLLAILLVIVLIIWGPGKLPDVGSGMGRAIREFRKASSETREEFAKATRGDDTTAATPAAAAPVAAATPVAPEAVAIPVPAAPVQPAPLGSGSVTGPAPDGDPR
jgi:TatA/E family protein of Tat protein translocase